MEEPEPEPEPYSSLPERLRIILDQADRDCEAGLSITDPKRPGVRFSPAAAAVLMAFELEEMLEPGTGEVELARIQRRSLGATASPRRT
jgi:hypothetical protein